MMAAQPGVQEILAKIRERVQARAPRPVPSQIGTPASDAGTKPVLRYDTTDLRLNLQDCNLLHNAVGTLNPRNPGLLNRGIQFFKRLMNRSLSWYTRPLHQFHAAVTRTLNEMTKVQDSLDAAVRRLETDIQNRDAQNAEFRQATERRIADLQRAIEDMRRQNDRRQEDTRQPQMGSGTGTNQNTESLASGRAVMGSERDATEIKAQVSPPLPAAEQKR
jgi:hypothetical protein